MFVFHERFIFIIWFFIKFSHTLRCTVLNVLIAMGFDSFIPHVTTAWNNIENISIIPESPLKCPISCFMPPAFWALGDLCPTALLTPSESRYLSPFRSAWKPHRDFSCQSFPAFCLRKGSFLHLMEILCLSGVSLSCLVKSPAFYELSVHLAKTIRKFGGWMQAWSMPREGFTEF